MAITDQAAIKFSNDHFRTIADKIARSYYRLAQLNDQWGAITGDNDTKFGLLEAEIREVATLVARTFFACFRANKIYDALSLNAVIPNDNLEVLHDGVDGPDLNRPTVTGQDLRRLKNRMEEFQHWLDAAQFVNDSGVTNPIDHVILTDFLRLTDDGAKTPTTNWGRQVAVVQAEVLRLEYEVTNTSYLTHILTVSPRFTES